MIKLPGRGKLPGSIGWAFIAVGAFGLSVWIPLAYLLFSGQVRPGEPYCVGDLAPSYKDLVAGVLLYLMF